MMNYVNCNNTHNEVSNADKEKLLYRIKITSSIRSLLENISDPESQNRFLVCYRLQNKDIRFSYNLYGKSWYVGDTKMSYKEFKMLSDTYDFPEIIYEVISDIYSDRLMQAKKTTFEIFRDSEKV